jgi:tripartite-type tricarboxylate transporter receptor subunit TctC
MSTTLRTLAAGGPTDVIARIIAQDMSVALGQWFIAEMRKSPAKPETKDRMKALGAITIADTPAEYHAFLNKDYERWARVIKAAGIKSE